MYLSVRKDCGILRGKIKFEELQRNTAGESSNLT